MHFSSLLAAALSAGLVASHPGHDVQQEALERREFLKHATRRDLSHCAAKLKARGHEAASIKRRAEQVKRLAKVGTLNERDLATLLNTSHHSNEAYTSATPESTIFAGNNSCVLSPEVTEGPYYVAGEYVRQDVTEEQAGVDMTIDVQVVDVATCEPVPGAYLEIWHCNSTGVYSGVSAGGNGNSDSDTSNLDATFLRGVQLTDAEGAVQFATLFPGHYTGRTTHIHVMVHMNATALANGTLRSTTASHVGQMFFDQDLITQVEATAVYSANTQALTTNAEDNILGEEAGTSDPFMEYVLLGDSVEKGIFAWLGFGIDTTVSKNVSAAATLYKTGGQANPNAGGGPGGPPPSGSGRPSGGFPTSTGGAIQSTASVSGARRRM